MEEYAMVHSSPLLGGTTFAPSFQKTISTQVYLQWLQLYALMGEEPEMGLDESEKKIWVILRIDSGKQ